ncbi:hypothetical protein ACFQ5N_02135 [Lutibacter holmesii]|uniref:Lipoprotein n=1 Tax=Lutibacter holmesii TaxID=1137985 RepID=A0ABW3WKE9_9FLAO
MKKLIYIILIISCFVACKPSKNIVETHSTDTIYKSKVITVDNPQLTNLVIENVCDSVGNLRPFVFNASSGKIKTEIKTTGNKIHIHQNIDSIKQVAVNEYKSSIKTQTIETIKYKNKKVMWYSILLNIALLVYIFRKPILAVIKKFIFPI